MRFGKKSPIVFGRSIYGPDLYHMPEKYKHYLLADYKRSHWQFMHEIIYEITKELLQPYEVYTELFDYLTPSRRVRRVVSDNGLADDLFYILKAYEKTHLWHYEDWTLFLSHGDELPVLDFLYQNCWFGSNALNEYWRDMCRMYAYAKIPEGLSAAEQKEFFHSTKPDLFIAFDEDETKLMTLIFKREKELDARVRDVVKRVCAKWGVAPEWRV